jgi:DNA-binding NarL/FixJ family response regulator
MRSVLLVDDGRAYAPAVARKLARELGTGVEVVYAEDTDEALPLLATSAFDVAVVDVLFRPATESFERQRRAGRVSARHGPFLTSGLAVLKAARDATLPTVVWTDGGNDRLLHMRYAYEEFGTRVFCRKDDLVLAEAVRAARSGGEVIPSSLAEEGLRPGTNRVAGSLFRRAHWAKVWRILAIGEATTHDEVDREAKGWFPYAKRLVGEMATEAANLHAFTVPGRNPLHSCNRFASKNALFLLDATVHELHP